MTWAGSSLAQDPVESGGQRGWLLPPCGQPPLTRSRPSAIAFPRCHAIVLLTADLERLAVDLYPHVQVSQNLGGASGKSSRLRSVTVSSWPISLAASSCSRAVLGTCIVLTFVPAWSVPLSPEGGGGAPASLAAPLRPSPVCTGAVPFSPDRVPDPSGQRTRTHAAPPEARPREGRAGLSCPQGPTCTPVEARSQGRRSRAKRSLDGESGGATSGTCRRSGEGGARGALATKRCHTPLSTRTRAGAPAEDRNR